MYCITIKAKRCRFKYNELIKCGQIIAKKIPGLGKYYKFKNPDKLESFIRKQLRTDDAFVAESNKCFDSAIKLFEDLKKHLNN